MFPDRVSRSDDLTAGRALGSTFGPQSGTTGATQTWTLAQTIPAGHKIRATITNVSNPGTATTTNQIGIDTSSDTAGNSSDYSTTAKNSVTPDIALLSNHAAAATGVTYSVLFTTSPSTGTLYNSQGTIT